MSERIKTWGDLGFVNNKRKDEPVPELNPWENLSESDIATAQKENLTRDEALTMLDHWFDANGDTCIGPKHPLKRVILGLRLNSPYTPVVNGSSWITIERHDTGKIIAVARDIKSKVSLSFHGGTMHKDVRTQIDCLGSFALRDVQKEIA
jgi:hypothetical protein